MLRHLILAALLVASLVAHSQNGVGDWRVHPYYVGSEVKNIIDTTMSMSQASITTMTASIWW